MLLLNDKQKYSIEIENNDKGVLKIFTLALCIIVDLIIFASIIGALSTAKYLDILWYAIGFVVISFIQYIATFLTHKIHIEFDDGVFIVKKVYPLKTKTIINALASQIKIYNIEDNDAFENNIKKAYRMCVNTCSYPIYVIELSGKKYLLNLDDYMYSIVKERE